MIYLSQRNKDEFKIGKEKENSLGRIVRYQQRLIGIIGGT